MEVLELWSVEVPVFSSPLFHYSTTPLLHSFLLFQYIRQFFLELQAFRAFALEIVINCDLRLLNLNPIVAEVLCHHRSLYQMGTTGFVFLQNRLRLLRRHERDRKSTRLNSS